jgi:hypothetical protein
MSAKDDLFLDVYFASIENRHEKALPGVLIDTTHYLKQHSSQLQFLMWNITETRFILFVLCNFGMVILLCRIRDVDRL